MSTELDTTWTDDLLERELFCNKLDAFIDSRYERGLLPDSGMVLNISSGWGTGKTFLIERYIKQKANDGKAIPIYFNAWEHDFAPDPFACLFVELQSQLKGILPNSKSTKDIAKKVTKAGKLVLKNSPQILARLALKRLTGINTEELVEEIKAAGLGDALDSLLGSEALDSEKQYSALKSSIASFNKHLEELATALSDAHDMKLIIFVDELDRCRPNYSIEVLETLKHIFGCKHVFFIVATDTRQLAASVKNIYGSEFEAQKYLKRFFNYTFALPAPRPDSTQKLFEKLLVEINLNSETYRPKLILPYTGGGPDSRDPWQHFASNLRQVADSFSLSPRDIYQTFEVLDYYLSSLQNENKTTSIPALAYFVICLRHEDMDLYSIFKDLIRNGENPLSRKHELFERYDRITYGAVPIESDSFNHAQMHEAYSYLKLLSTCIDCILNGHKESPNFSNYVEQATYIDLVNTNLRKSSIKDICTTVEIDASLD